MLRDECIEEIYDGRFYTPGDMVMVGCADCAGCSDCCRNTEDTIILDPYDMYMLALGTGKSFTDMIEREIEIRLVDGLALPNLLQHRNAPVETSGTVPSGDGCPFLSTAGRCTIHPFRPGLCRLYPMGRYYTEDRFFYILQKNECTGREKTPVLLRDWLSVEDLPRYEEWILDWHRFKKAAGEAMGRLTSNSRSSVRNYILQLFFVHPYLADMDFYPQYAARMEVCRGQIGQIL